MDLNSQDIVEKMLMAALPHDRRPTEDEVMETHIEQSAWLFRWPTTHSTR